MRILVVGATGLIGSSICARALAEGHRVLGLARERGNGLAGAGIEELDFAAAVRPESWIPYLNGIDAVVNCAGILQESARDKMREVHATAPAALFLACERSGIRKLIHFSAIGVDREQPSSFSMSKREGEQALMQRDLDWVILRPSVVLGRPVYGASALIRGLAALPIRPVMPNTGPLQVVQLDEVVATVLFFLQPSSPSRIAIDLAGPEKLAMDDVAAIYRRWLGWPDAHRLMLPPWAGRLFFRLGDIAGKLGWRPPVRSNAEKEITRGATGDPSQWTKITGIQPRALGDGLAINPPTIQERWFAKLYFVKPLAFVVLPFFWLMTGIISLTSGYENGVQLMRDAGAGALSGPSVILGAIADIIVGALIAWRPTTRWGLFGAIVLSVFYAAAGSILRPDLWNEPLGPFLKILPIVVCHLAALAILDER